MIIKPVLTEKALIAQGQSRYYFLVDTKATKSQIKTEFQSLFSIKPLRVNIFKTKGKIKTNWKNKKPIKKPDLKKAIVTIKKGEKIELLSLKDKK